MGGWVSMGPIEWEPNIFPKSDVKLSYIEEFYTICGGRDKLEGSITTEVCDKYKPLTE